jgi:hypothetical protein
MPAYPHRRVAIHFDPVSRQRCRPRVGSHHDGCGRLSSVSHSLRPRKARGIVSVTRPVTVPRHGKEKRGMRSNHLVRGLMAASAAAVVASAALSGGSYASVGENWTKSSLLDRADAGSILSSSTQSRCPLRMRCEDHKKGWTNQEGGYKECPRGKKIYVKATWWAEHTHPLHVRIYTSTSTPPEFHWVREGGYPGAIANEVFAQPRIRVGYWSASFNDCKEWVHQRDTFAGCQ